MFIVLMYTECHTYSMSNFHICRSTKIGYNYNSTVSLDFIPLPYIITIWRGAAVLSVLQLGLDVEKELEVVGGILGDCDGGDVPSSPVDRGQGQHSGGRGLEGRERY